MMKKMDEMEKTKSLYAIRNTFVFTILFQVIYFMIECYRAGGFVAKESIMFFFIVCQGIVFSLSTFIFEAKVDDNRGIKSLIYTLLLAVVAIILGILLK